MPGTLLSQDFYYHMDKRFTEQFRYHQTLIFQILSHTSAARYLPTYVITGKLLDCDDQAQGDLHQGVPYTCLLHSINIFIKPTFMFADKRLQSCSLHFIDFK